jgi:glutaredoxin 3
MSDLSEMPAVEIYTREFCGYCDAAKALLRRKGVAFTEIDVTGNRERRAEMSSRAQGRMTVPQIFIGSAHIGGCDELYALDQSGGLDPLLSA